MLWGEIKLPTVLVIILCGISAVAIFIAGYFIGRKSSENLRRAMKIDGETCRKVLAKKYAAYKATLGTNSDVPLWLIIEGFSTSALEYVRLKHPLAVMSPDLFWSTLFQAIRMTGIEQVEALNEARRTIEGRHANALPSKAMHEAGAPLPSDQ